VEHLSINLIEGSISDIVKFYILKKDNINIKEKQEIFKDDNFLLDDAAIFLRILDKNILNISDNYINNYKQLEKILSVIKENIPKIINFEEGINKILEEYSPKLFDSDLDSGFIKMSIKPINFVKQEYSAEKLKDNLEKLKIFYKKLLSKNGRLNGGIGQNNLKIKLGFMFEYFELSDSLLNITTKTISDINDYQKYQEIQVNYISKIPYNIVSDIEKLYPLNNEQLEKFIKHVNEFIGNENK
jgi:hypothetical protein